MSSTFSRSGRPPVPPGTPDELREQIVWEVREPCGLDRSNLEVPVDLLPQSTEPPHRLVILGDSVSHGFKSFAIAETARSWPALIARYGGIEPFRFPAYDGPSVCPGLPLNLEALARDFQEHAPNSLLDVASDAILFRHLRKVMDDVEDHWERGDGAQAIKASGTGDVNHNLASWGWDLRDTLSRTVGSLRERVERADGQRDQLLHQIPSASWERSALLTLAGGEPEDTPLAVARRLGEDGIGDEPGIETLVVALGSNNILGTVLDFEIRWTPEDPDVWRDVDRKSRFNAWRPSHFAAEFDALVDAVKEIRARHVIFLTVPHVTIAPMMRGMRQKMPGDRYFARYTRAWFGDDVFNANRHPCLSGDHLRVLDFAVDRYNDHIVRRVREARSASSDARDWRLLDIAGVLDRLAYRRFLIDDEAQPPWWTPYELPDAYRERSPQPDTRFYRSDAFGRFEGGLFSLDGIHPSTIGYGIVAGEVMRVMDDCGVRLASQQPDYRELVEVQDRMICEPPTRIAEILDLVEWADNAVALLRALGSRSTK